MAIKLNMPEVTFKPIFNQPYEVTCHFTWRDFVSDKPKKYTFVEFGSLKHGDKFRYHPHNENGFKIKNYVKVDYNKLRDFLGYIPELLKNRYVGFMEPELSFVVFYNDTKVEVEVKTKTLQELPIYADFEINGLQYTIIQKNGPEVVAIGLNDSFKYRRRFTFASHTEVYPL